MASSIPSAVDGFMTLMTAVLPTDSTVVFSAVMPLYEAPLTLQVMGIHAGHQVPAELGPSVRREETYSIMCRLTSWAGDQKQLDRLTEAMAAWATITTAIANDPHLTGTPGGTGSAQTPVRFAQPSGFTFVPEAAVAGQSIGQMDFEVHCEARITSLT